MAEEAAGHGVGDGTRGETLVDQKQALVAPPVVSAAAGEPDGVLRQRGRHVDQFFLEPVGQVGAVEHVLPRQYAAQPLGLLPNGVGRDRLDVGPSLSVLVLLGAARAFPQVRLVPSQQEAGRGVFAGFQTQLA